MIVLDARVLIAHFDSRDAHHDRAGALLTRVAGADLVVSALTMAELLVGPARAGVLEHVRAGLARLQVGTAPLDEEAAVRLALLRVETGLKLPDCCVLLAAEQRAASLATFDERLARVATEFGVPVLSD